MSSSIGLVVERAPRPAIVERDWSSARENVGSAGLGAAAGIRMCAPTAPRLSDAGGGENRRWRRPPAGGSRATVRCGSYRERASAQRSLHWSRKPYSWSGWTASVRYCFRGGERIVQVATENGMILLGVLERMRDVAREVALEEAERK